MHGDTVDAGYGYKRGSTGFALLSFLCNLLRTSARPVYSRRTGSNGGCRRFERGVQRNQLNKCSFTTPINYNVHLLTNIRALLLEDVKSDYVLAHAFCRVLGIWWIRGLGVIDWN